MSFHQAIPQATQHASDFSFSLFSSTHVSLRRSRAARLAAARLHEERARLKRRREYMAAYNEKKRAGVYEANVARRASQIERSDRRRGVRVSADIAGTTTPARVNREARARLATLIGSLLGRSRVITYHANTR